MAEYIEREQIDFGSCKQYVLINGTPYVDLNEIARKIKSVPAADVVPVVRCRECIHYREHRTHRYKQLIRKCLRMARHDMTYPVKSDDFCSYGQRKKEEHEID